jgi:hypothetical protein
MVVLFGLGLFGLFVAPRPFVVLALGLLAYQTVMAMGFAGETRYRAPWDFLVAVLAAGAALHLAARVTARRGAGGLSPTTR